MNNLFTPLIGQEALPANFLRFYTVGLLLFVFPFTRPLFISITALSLLIVIGLVFLYHSAWTYKTILCFLLIYLLAFFIEMAGVNTGKIFGNYRYEEGLGIQWKNTPLIIGLNWVFLIYTTHDIAGQLTRKTGWQILAGALLMVLYDIFLESAAPVMHMWRFRDNLPPFNNYMAWFLLSVLFHCMLKLFRVESDNRPARALFFIQLLFLFAITLFNQLILSDD